MMRSILMNIVPLAVFMAVAGLALWLAGVPLSCVASADTPFEVCLTGHP